MDFANRIRRRGADLTTVEIFEFGRLAGLDRSDLVLWALPVLQRAGILTYTLSGADVSGMEEFVGASAPILQQTCDVWSQLHPTTEDECALDVVALGASAPLTLSDHQAALDAMGYHPDVTKRALAAAGALGLLRRVHSADLGEDIVFNEYVWGENAPRIAAFLNSLPADERTVLAHLSGQAMEHPGVPVTRIAGVQAEVMRGARKVGFIDAARVVTATNRQESFVFSPALEREMAKKNASDALHDRKLFVAHMLFGHYFGFPGTGRIDDPMVLARALLNRGTVGPATAITSDYPLLESFGIVRVRPSAMQKGRSYLELVKKDVVEDSLALLSAASGAGGGVDLSEQDPLEALWLPGTFVDPERDRHALHEPKPEAKELFDYTIQRLRNELGRVTRGEEF